MTQFELMLLAAAAFTVINLTMNKALLKNRHRILPVVIMSSLMGIIVTLVFFIQWLRSDQPATAHQ